MTGVRVPDERLDELAVLAAKATPGPWHLSNVPYSSMVYTDHPQGRRLVSHPPMPEDAAFIAAVGTDLADLVADLRDAREVLRFYANEDTWRYCPTDRGAEHAASDDRGKRARAALAEEPRA